MQTVDETLRARALVQQLSPSELAALRNVAAGGSVRNLAKRLSKDVTDATEIMNSMMAKLGASRNADAARVAIRAGICE